VTKDNELLKGLVYVAAVTKATDKNGHVPTAFHINKTIG